MKKRKSVALLIESSNAYARGLLEGIIRYQKEHDAWSIVLPEQERGALPPSWLKRWRGDGMIVRIENDAVADALRSVKIPIVDVSAARRLENLPWVETDDLEIARIAFNHLRSRGYQNFAFCGLSTFNWSQWRQQAFVDCCEQAKFTCKTYQCSIPTQGRAMLSPSEISKMKRWISRLPRPTAIMAAYDIHAQVLLDICRDLNLAVPEQIAILGVDNDPLICDLSFPSLTSVIPDAIGAGNFAASLLDQAMDKKKVAPKAYLMKPLGIAERQSTSAYAVQQIDLANALQFIRIHACEGINVADVVNASNLSRRNLELSLKKATGKSPHRLILARRLERVAELLRDTDLAQEKIAANTGFEYPEYMNASFTKEFGLSPGKYRKKHRSEM